MSCEETDQNRGNNVKDTFFNENSRFTYKYTSSVESSFVGTTPSKSGFQFTCDIKLGVFSDFRSVLKVENCQIFNRDEDREERYTEVLSEEFASDISRYPLHFTFNKNQINASSIQVHKDDPVYSVNIKRGILSSLQLELLGSNEKNKTVTQVDMFGPCKVQYTVYDTAPYNIVTSRDLTLCQMPQIFTLQMRLFSVIKKLHGGFRQTETLEPIYPFKSTLVCQYKISNKVIDTAECKQQQAFKPAAYNGSIYASAITNIQQKFTLDSVSSITDDDAIGSTSEMKNVDFLFEFHEEKEMTVSQKMVQDQLHSLVKSYNDLDLKSWPELYQDFVWFMKHSTEENLQLTITDILNCHGNPKESCDQDTKMLEQEYFVDGLLSCATEACITVFTKCIKEEHVSLVTSRHFLYDLAMNHAPTEDSVELVLDICKKTESKSCWLPLSIMVNKLYTETSSVEDTKQKEGIIYQTISTLSEELEKTLQNGDKVKSEDVSRIIMILKALGNIGKAVQDVYDGDEKLTKSILNLSDRKLIQDKVVKSAIQVFEKMKMTTLIKEKLVLLISDINRPSVIRAVAFSVLFKSSDQEVIQKIINLIHTEEMDYMQTYMVSYVEGLLENDQPDQKWLRTAWQTSLLADGRPLPVVDEFLLGKSRYMELSRYFRLPFSVTHYGVQLEFDLVYDPASPLIKSAVVRLNYYKEEKVNLLELTAEIKGLEDFLDAVFQSKGKGLYSLMSLFTKVNETLAKGVNPQFADFDKLLSEAINSMIKIVNYPASVFPDGMLTFKFYGYEVMYIDIGEILATFVSKPAQMMANTASQQSRQGHQRGFMSNIMMMVSKGYRLIKTRSAKVVDLTKVIPTLAGAPLNMTVLLTTSMGLDVRAKADISQYMRGTGPVLANGEISTGFAGEFFGQMIVTLGDVGKAGCRMLGSLNAKGHFEASAKLEKGSHVNTTLSNYTAYFKRKNIDGDYNLALIRSRLYHLHDDWLEVPADLSVQTTKKKCTGTFTTLITGNTACMEFTYPDVTESTTHAYFPLSGPFSMDFVLSRIDKDMKHFNLEVNYLITNDSNGHKRHVDLTYSAPGKKLRRQLNINVEESLTSDSSVATINMPETGVSFNVVKKDLNFDDIVEKQTRTNYERDFHLKIKNFTLFRTMFQVQRNITEEVVYDPKEEKDAIGNKTETKTVFKFAASGISLDVSFQNLKEKLSSHINTNFYLRYYCSKYSPLLYQLHIRPTLAAANNDVSEVEVVNDAVMGYQRGEKKLWTAQDSLRISYPGQKFSLTNDMVANDTNANRKTVITFIGAENKQEIIEMNSDVETKRDESNNHYCYHMTLEHKGRYDILLQGHLQGNLKKTLSVQTNIHYKKKMLKTDGDAPVKSNTGDLSIQDGTNKKHCTIFELDEWKTEINLTVDASPVFVSGQSRPNGIEFIWHLDVLYPDCNSESMIISDGAIGSNLRNVFEDFRYWFRNNVAMISTSQILPKIYDMAFNAEYLKCHHFDYHFLFNGPGLNTSYDIHSDRFLNNTGNINVNCHLESDWKLFNFDYSEIYVIVYKGSEMDVSRVDHSLDAKCAIFDVSLDSILVKDESGLAVVQDGFINIRYPILSGRTNISSQVTLSKKSRSGVNVKLTRNEMDYHMDVAVHSPKAIDTSFSLKQPNGPKVFVVSFLSELVGSTSKETTIQWNPVFTQRGIEILKAKQLQLSNALSTASETLTKNLGKSISSMVIPFVNETVGYVVSKVAVPVVHYLPLPKSIKTMMTANLHQHSKTNLGNAVKNEGTQEEIQNDDNRIVYFGQMLCDFVTKLQSNLLYMMSRLLIEPPAAVTNMVKIVLKPNLHEALRTNKFSFIQPLLLKWKHFMSLPTLTKGQQYIYGLIKTRYGPQQIESGVKTALLYDKSEILTFDGKLYQMKDSSTCPYLLTADVKHGNFAVVVSNDGITVLTRTSMATIHRGGQVFINSCNQPINFPYFTEELHIIKKNVSRVITLDYGLTISCDINNNHCNFGLRHHHNETIGLLGNNDGEIGNDFKLAKGEITLNTDQFVKSYELAESQSCVPPVVNMLSQVKACDDLQKKCVNLFNTASSPLAVCFLKVDPAPFSESCQERVKNCMPYSLCPSVHAYISKCDIAGVIIEASEQLDTCKETYPTAGEIPPKALLDIVIILYKDKNDSFCLPCIETFVRFLQTCDKTDVEITFSKIDSEQLSLNEALMKSTQHHFRLHTQKIVSVIKADQDLSEEEYQILKDSFLNKDILLNVISHYKILRHRGLVGLDWDKEIIAVNKILDETKELPQDFLIKLMSQTKGALFNANFLEKNMKTRMAGLVKHICERQAYSSTKC